MQKKPEFLSLLVEPVENGYLVEISTGNEDAKHVFTSARLALRFIKERMKVTAGDE